MLYKSDIMELMKYFEGLISELPSKGDQNAAFINDIKSTKANHNPCNWNNLNSLLNKLLILERKKGGKTSQNKIKETKNILSEIKKLKNRPTEDECDAIATGKCSSAEGCSTRAIGDCAHAEGCLTTANADCSHAEGGGTVADGTIASHAEGIVTTANEIASHAEGLVTTTSGVASHAEGILTTANGIFSHAEGFDTESSGNSSHAEGCYTLASEDCSHAEGCNTTANADCSHAEGGGTTASGDGSHAEGGGTTASGNDSHAEGRGTSASGVAAHAEGYSTSASMDTAHAEGDSTKATALASHAEGLVTEANQTATHAEGANTTANVFASHAQGYYTNANNEGAHIMGRYGNTCENYAWHMAGGTEADRLVTAIIRNNGNACFQSVNICPPCPDYAEMFETIDGKTIDVGYFVTLEADKIRKATSNDDYILGVTTSTSAVLGGTAELNWKDKYLKDEWGRFQYEEVTIPAKKDKEGELIRPERTEMKKILNPEYDKNQEYISRTERPEWIPVGMIGQILVRDDGSCEANGYCSPNDDGIATASKSGYRVMKRTGKNQILIVYK